MNESGGIAVFLVAAIGIFTSGIISALLQIRKVNQEKSIHRKMQRLRRSVQPWVTVLLYANNNEDTLAPSVKALLKNKYHNFDIVVVDQQSHDASLVLLKKFLTTQKNKNVALLRRRVAGSKIAALQAGYKKSKKGEVVIAIDADVIVSAQFIKRAVAMKDTQDFVLIKLPPSRSVDSVLNIIASFWRLLLAQSPSASVSTARYFLRRNIKPKGRYVKNLTKIGITLLLAGVFLYGFMSNSLVFIWYVWLLFTLYLTTRVWLEEYQTLQEKIKLTFSVPTAFFLLPASTIVLGFSQLITRK